MEPGNVEHAGGLDNSAHQGKRRKKKRAERPDALLRYLIEHPTETLDRTHEQQSRVEQEKRLNELKDYALSLKEESADGEVKPQ